MSTDTFLGCELDEAALQPLGEWLSELRTAEAACVAIEAQLATDVLALEVTTPIVASLTTGTDVLGNRVIITAKTPGTAAHEWAFMFLAQSPGQVLNVTVSGRVVVVELETEDSGTWVPPVIGYSTRASALVAALSGISTLTDELTFANPDLADGIVDPLPLTHLSGGNDAPVQGTEDAINQIFGHAGLNYHGALAAIRIPDATLPTAMADAVDLVQLASGKLLKVTGTNLVEPRSLWLLLGSDTEVLLETLAAVPLVYPVGYSSEDLETGALEASYAHPVVVWVQTQTTVLAIDVCQGGGTKSVMTRVRVGNPNSRPTQDGLDPVTYWLEAVNQSTNSMRFMAAIGMSQAQQLTAVEPTSPDTHVITDPLLQTRYGLTVNDLEELLASSLAGIAAVPLEATLAALAGVPVSPATGNVIPAWSTDVEVLRSELVPDQAYASEMAALASSECIDLGVKAVIATLVAALNAPLDMALRIVTRVQKVVAPILSKISSLLAAIYTALTLDVAISCVVGLSISFEGPTVDLMITKIKFMAPGIKSLRLSVEGIIGQLTPKLCSVQTAIKNLISPGSSELDCLVKALSNLLVNALGALKNLLPCIESPFDALVLFDGINDKVNALVGMLNGMLNGLRMIEAQANALSNVTIETPTTSSIRTCQSPSLSTIVARLRSAVGLG